MVALPPGGKQGLYYGDNLDILREFPAEFVDLVYIDPPFNSQRDYNVVFDGSIAEEKAFEDTWSFRTITQESELIQHEPQRYAPLLRYLAATEDLLGKSALQSYLIMMSVRIVELHRVLKPTGSFYLHCDPTASHYLKTLLDCVFGSKNFRSEIIWRRKPAHNKLSRQFGPIHDVILFYTKSDKFVFHPGRRPYPTRYIEGRFKGKDAKGIFRQNELTGSGTRNGESGKPWRGFDPTPRGRHWAIPSTLKELLPGEGEGMTSHEKLDYLANLPDGQIEFPKDKDGWPTYKQYVGAGVPFQDLWAFQPGSEGILWGTDEAIDQDVKWLEAGDEKLGYPTQKPLGLMERIISTSTDKDSLVLDAFCGCGTTVAAAEKLGRSWIGIDITFRAVDLIRKRIIENYYGKSDDVFKEHVYVHGVPKDEASARHLATSTDRLRKEFEKWACTVLGGIFQEKKGPDGGMDGFIPMRDTEGRIQQCIIQVKSGKIGIDTAKVLNSSIDFFKAPCGVLFSLEPPTKPIIDYVRTLAPFRPMWGGVELDPVPRIQIITATDHFSGKKPEIPGRMRLEKKAEVVAKHGPKQKKLPS